jgi:cytochrome c1
VKPLSDRVIVGGGLGLLVLAATGLVGERMLDHAHERFRIAIALTGGDPMRAPPLVVRYGCGGCHTVPGVPGASGRVAPPLEGLIERVYIAGSVQNTAKNLVAWIIDPQAFEPHAAMPRTGIGEQEARDVAAYLYAH